MLSRIWLSKAGMSLLGASLVAIALTTTVANASDHDDGERDLKGRAVNLTDVYAFREDNQTGNNADDDKLVLIMNTNPRSLPGQQYFFSPDVVYQFNLSRVAAADKTKAPNGRTDMRLRFRFSQPGANNRQNIRAIMFKDGERIAMDDTIDGKKISTTDIGASKANQLVLNELRLGNDRMWLFAGLREDPFFFDVEQFFKVRAAALATGKFIGFTPPEQARDFTKNYNVNTIVVKVPIRALQTGGKEPVFDVWATLHAKK